MATKTISIDIEAYERLRSVRQGRESFSQTIKRVVRPPLDYETFQKRLADLAISDKAAEAIEEQVRGRSCPSNRESY